MTVNVINGGLESETPADARVACADGGEDHITSVLLRIAKTGA